MADEVRVAIEGDADLVTARAEARAMAERLGFPRPDPTLIATAISEIARNILVHAGRGETRDRASATSRPPCGTTSADAAASGSACPAPGG